MKPLGQQKIIRRKFMLLDIVEKEFLKPLSKNNGDRVEEIFQEFEIFCDNSKLCVMNPEVKSIYTLIQTAIHEYCFYYSCVPNEFIDRFFNEFTYSRKVDVLLEFAKAVKNKLKFYGEKIQI